jgi:hypothetical protein
VRVPGPALHIPAMSTLTHTHVRRVSTEYRITVMETPEDQQYYGLTYDNYPNSDGTVTRYIGDGYEKEHVQFMGMYLVEELDSEGRPNRWFELLTPKEFKEQFVELGDPGLIYGVRSDDPRLDVSVTTGTLESARIGVQLLLSRNPLGKFEVVSLPRDSDDDSATWTVVGR